LVFMRMNYQKILFSYEQIRVIMKETRFRPV